MDIKFKYKILWDRACELGKTSSILNVERNSLTFARTGKYLNSIKDANKPVDVVVPYTMPRESIRELPNCVNVHILLPEDDLQYVFTCIHNELNKDRHPKPNDISVLANIHHSAIVGVHGNTYCTCPDGSKMNLKHMGNVVIEDDADIEALCIVHRASMSSTIVKKGAKICVKVNVGHNCIVGERTIIAPGVLLGGGTKIGADCCIWQGVITRSNITICDNVVIGAGSLVLHDITDPGIYFGTPAKYVKPYDPKLR